MKKEKEIAILKQSGLTDYEAKMIIKEGKADITTANTEEELKQIIEDFSLEEEFREFRELRGYQASELEFLEDLDDSDIVECEGARYWIQRTV